MKCQHVPYITFLPLMHVLHPCEMSLNDIYQLKKHELHGIILVCVCFEPIFLFVDSIVILF